MLQELLVQNPGSRQMLIDDFNLSPKFVAKQLKAQYFYMQENNNILYRTDKVVYDAVDGVLDMCSRDYNTNTHYYVDARTAMANRCQKLIKEHMVYKKSIYQRMQCLINYLNELDKHSLLFIKAYAANFMPADFLKQFQRLCSLKSHRVSFFQDQNRVLNSYCEPASLTM